jgi:ribosomal protein S15P/S13E
MLKNLSIILVCVFLGVAIFSFYKAVSLFRANNALNQQINEVFKPAVEKLEQDNVKINDELAKAQTSLAKTQGTLLVVEEENRVLKDELDAQKTNLIETQALLGEKEKTLVSVISNYDELKSENNMLKDKFSSLYEEFLIMKKTLTSMDGLKTAIKNLRAHLKKNKKTVTSKKKILLQENKLRKNKENKIEGQNQESQVIKQESVSTEKGNRGFLMRDGKSTYVPKLRIKVTPVEE